MAPYGYLHYRWGWWGTVLGFFKYVFCNGCTSDIHCELRVRPCNCYMNPFVFHNVLNMQFIPMKKGKNKLPFGTCLVTKYVLYAVCIGYTKWKSWKMQTFSRFSISKRKVHGIKRIIIVYFYRHILKMNLSLSCYRILNWEVWYPFMQSVRWRSFSQVTEHDFMNLCRFQQQAVVSGDQVYHWMHSFLDDNMYFHIETIKAYAGFITTGKTNCIGWDLWH